MADQVTQLLIMTFIDSRVYPMFAFLFGYGMVQLYTRQVASGLPVHSGPPAAAEAQPLVAWPSAACMPHCSGSVTCWARTGWPG